MYKVYFDNIGTIYRFSDTIINHDPNEGKIILSDISNNLQEYYFNFADNMVRKKPSLLGIKINKKRFNVGDEVKITNILTVDSNGFDAKIIVYVFDELGIEEQFFEVVGDSVSFSLYGKGKFNIVCNGINFNSTIFKVEVV